MTIARSATINQLSKRGLQAVIANGNALANTTDPISLALSHGYKYDMRCCYKQWWV